MKWAMVLGLFFLMACGSSEEVVTEPVPEPVVPDVESTIVEGYDDRSALLATCNGFTVYNPTSEVWSLYGDELADYIPVTFFLDGLPINGFTCDSAYLSLGGEVFCKYDFPSGEHQFWVEGPQSAKVSLTC